MALPLTGCTRGTTFAQSFKRERVMASTPTSEPAPIREAAPEPADGLCEVFYVDDDRVGRVRDAMLSEDLVEQVADLFKVLAHPTRVRILRALAKEELCVCDLSQVLGLSVSATSHQLRAMRTMKLVRYRRDGKLAYYSLRDPFVAALLEDGVRHLTDEGRPG